MSQQAKKGRGALPGEGDTEARRLDQGGIL